MANPQIVWGPGSNGPRTYRYRYALDFDGADHVNRCVWLMLNPSTADEAKPDPTITRCINFASAWGYTGIDVVNLFALRATDPDELRAHPDPIGPANNGIMLQTIRLFGMVVAGWGRHGELGGRGLAVYRLLLDHHQVGKLHALAVNKSGAPTHPLYLKSTLLPLPWKPPELTTHATRC